MNHRRSLCARNMSRSIAIDKILIWISGLVEVGTGFGLILFPGTAAWLIFDADIGDLSKVFARIAGIALLSLAIGCAPPSWRGHRPAALCAMLALNGMLFIYLAGLGILVGYNGLLFWPAVALHGILAAAMISYWYCYRSARRAQMGTD